MILASLVVAAYLIGAIPFGLLFGRLRGVDIRLHGSRNIGATNVGRVLGRKWGLLCLALDILKGVLPVAAAGLILPGDLAAERLLSWLLVGLAAVLGHVFPIYLGFRGGKGVATTIGVAVAIYPYYTVAMLIALVAYGLVRFTTGLISLGSLTIAIVFPLALLAYLRVCGVSLGDAWPLQAGAVLLGTLIVVRHRGNIRRLLRGEEMSPAQAPAAAKTPDCRHGDS